MGLKNKKGDMTPFDMAEKPRKQFLPLAVLLWAVSYIMTARFGMTVKRINMKGLKPPFLVLSTHQGFSDYYILPRLLFPFRANYVSDMEGFAGYGKQLYRMGGCIGKRRYVSDTAVIRNIGHALYQLKQPVVIFPESRHCDVGITSRLPDNMGRLVKHFNVPLVTVSVHGSYLANPFWDEGHTRKTKMSAVIEQIYTKDEISRMSAEDIQKTIEKKLAYDEYAWQAENRVEIGYPRRAEGLHLPLYKCICCHSEGCMESRSSELYCTACGESWHMDKYGRLTDSSGVMYHIPDWYSWERECVRNEIMSGGYKGIEVPVRVEALPNEKGFVPMGSGLFSHDMNGCVLRLDDMDSAAVRTAADKFPLTVNSSCIPSIHTEYDYRGRGKCVVLSTRDCCYYIYSSSPEFIVTKLEFAAEEIFGYNKMSGNKNAAVKK